MESQTPNLPDPSTLKDLPPAVAITFLVVFVVIVLLVYFGQPLRERLKRRAGGTHEPPERTRTAVPSLPAPVAAAAASADRTDQFIDNLLRQIENCEAENERIEQRAEDEVRRLDKRAAADVARLERRIDELERQVLQLRDDKAQLREENERLRTQLMWQRGPHQ